MSRLPSGARPLASTHLSVQLFPLDLIPLAGFIPSIRQHAHELLMVDVCIAQAKILREVQQFVGLVSPLKSPSRQFRVAPIPSPPPETGFGLAVTVIWKLEWVSDSVTTG